MASLKFKKIEMFGFKSFADKIEVKFEPGVTGIVGPNGCGKSNVSDAIRWVMGEQSAKALRGANMQDVIFNGTDDRKSQSFCEVSLYFDNTDKTFPLSYDEVVLTRKLYRSGESEYMINKQPCRMKDIVDALRDTGLGRDSYCIIGQGKIDSLLSVKPEDRRAIFEEAAGISKFKNRKLEAERKLERTMDNITRLSDIIGELERQLGPLKEQSENAKKFLELREVLKNLELNIYVSQYESASDNKAKISEKISELTEELELKQTELVKVLEEYNFSRESINNLDYSIEKLRDEQLNLTVNLEKLSGQSNVVREKLSNTNNNISRLNNEIGQDEALSSALSQEIENLKNKKEELNKTLEKSQEKLEKTNEEYLEVVDRITAGETAAQESGNELYSALEKISDVKGSLGSLTAEKTSLESRKDELEKRKAEIEKEKKTVKEKIATLEESLKEVEDEIKVKTNEQNGLIGEVSVIKGQLNDYQTSLAEANAQYHTLLSRAKLMQEMAEENEGYIISVKRLLEQSKTNSSLGGKIIGVVAKLMKVPEMFETAIEMALGASVQNIVTKNEDDAKFIVNYLKEKRFGRATFLPITSMKERAISSEFLPKLKAPGVLGIASDLVSFDKAHAPVFKSLLGSTVIVDSIDNAVNLARSTKYGFKIVTLDGDVINPQGSISGGSKKDAGVNLLGRERELEDTKKATQQLKAEIERLTDKISQLEAKKEKNNSSLTKLAGLIHEVEVKKVKFNDEIDGAKLSLDQALANERSVIVALEGITDRLEIIKAALKEAESQEKEINSEKTSASEMRIKLAEKFEALKAQRENLYEELTQLKVNIASTQSELDKTEKEIDRLETEQATSAYRLKENKLELQKNLAVIAEFEKVLSEFSDSSETEGIRSRLDEIKGELNNLDMRKASLQADMNNADTKKMDLNVDIQRVSDKKTKEEMNLAKIDTDIETMQERVWEEYSMTYADAVAFKEEGFDLTKGLSESSKVKKEINALGFVNVSAIEDVKEVSARYDELSAQREDLVKTQQDLVKLIGELTTQMEDKFLTEFKLINANFQKTFKELFGGGRAELVLHDDEPVLEAGIDIIAEPPGKKLQNISLLSGGEKAITAIAILFAILKLRPMPFCVLDEIEAALDDANVDRFAQYLKRFSEDTQFIVITHRKPTMELADCLYGVTMEEKGVSKMVSVKLSDAVKNSTEGASA